MSFQTYYVVLILLGIEHIRETIEVAHANLGFVRLRSFMTRNIRDVRHIISFFPIENSLEEIT